MKPPVELISDKLIMSLEGLPASNSPRKMDHPKCTIFTKDTVVLDVILQKCFKNHFLNDVICEKCSSGGSKSIKSTILGSAWSIWSYSKDQVRLLTDRELNLAV